MLFRKKEFKDLGEVNLEELEPISEIETKDINSVNKEDLPEDAKQLWEIILKLKKKEKLYNLSVIALVLLNLFLTAIIIYLGIVRIT